jgi:hypothetical protein
LTEATQTHKDSLIPIRLRTWIIIFADNIAIMTTAVAKYISKKILGESARNNFGTEVSTTFNTL